MAKGIRDAKSSYATGYKQKWHSTSEKSNPVLAIEMDCGTADKCAEESPPYTYFYGCERLLNLGRQGIIVSLLSRHEHVDLDKASFGWTGQFVKAIWDGSRFLLSSKNYREYPWSSFVCILERLGTMADSVISLIPYQIDRWARMAARQWWKYLGHLEYQLSSEQTTMVSPWLESILLEDSG